MLSVQQARTQIALLWTNLAQRPSKLSDLDMFAGRLQLSCFSRVLFWCGEIKMD